MELVVQLLTVAFVAILAKYLMDALHKIMEPFEGKDKKKAHRFYPAVNAVIAIFIAGGVHAAIATALGIGWYYPSIVEWLVTGLLASLGANRLHGFIKNFDAFKTWMAQRDQSDGK